MLHSALQQNTFFVKEHVGMLKASKNYDLLDPGTQEVKLLCREEGMGFLTRFLRFTDYRQYTPFKIVVKTPEGEPILSVERGWTIFRSVVTVRDGAGNVQGKFRQHFFSFGGRFDLLDTQDRLLCTLRGKWTSWEFYFEHEGRQLAQVTKKWAGIGKELFTSADNYMLTIDPSVPADNPIRIPILAAVLCIDLVLKE